MSYRVSVSNLLTIGFFLFHYRWFVYAFAGFCFGIADWYYLEFLIRIDWLRTQTLLTAIVAISINWGIWLVPAVPLAIVEMLRSNRVWFSSLAVALFWACAIIAYYVYYSFLLAFDGYAPLSLLQAVLQPSPTAWQDWGRITRTQTIAHISDWMWVAIIGGGMIGGSAAVFLRKYRMWGNEKELNIEPNKQKTVQK